MAEPTQFAFTMIEATEALIKSQGLHEGKWILNVEFTINVGMMGVGPDQVRPGAMFLANRLVLTGADTEANPPPNIVVDASIVNPAKKTAQKK